MFRSLEDQKSRSLEDQKSRWPEVWLSRSPDGQKFEGQKSKDQKSEGQKSGSPDGEMSRNLKARSPDEQKSLI